MTKPGTPDSDHEQLKVGLEQLTTFQNTVKTILDDLRAGAISNSPTGPPAPPGSYGTGFAESESVLLTFTGVTTRLEKFARTLRLQVEAMQLSVRMAADKTEAADTGNRQRLAALLQELAEPDGSPGRGVG